jgi:hypothetical protein
MFYAEFVQAPDQYTILEMTGAVSGFPSASKANGVILEYPSAATINYPGQPDLTGINPNFPGIGFDVYPSLYSCCATAEEELYNYSGSVYQLEVRNTGFYSNGTLSSPQPSPPPRPSPAPACCRTSFSASPGCCSVGRGPGRKPITLSRDCRLRRRRGYSRPIRPFPSPPKPQALRASPRTGVRHGR